MFPFLFAGYNLVLFAACLIINRKAKGLLTAWDGEEETVLDTIEHLLNYPILLGNIALILNLFAFPLSIQLAEWTDLGKKIEGFGILAVLVIFLLGYVWILAVQNAALKMEKTMKIEGMMCGHCEARVKKTLEGIEGVTEAKALGGAPVPTKRKTHNEASAKATPPVAPLAPAPREQEVQQGLPFVKSCKDYRFVKRSCNNCASVQSCTSIVGKDFRMSWLDLARCGCHYYNGPHLDERPISRP